MARFLALLLLCSCSQNRSWRVGHVDAGHSAFNSSKLCYRSDDAANGIDVEFLKTQHTLHLYLNVHAHPVPPYEGNAKQALVVFLAGDKKFTYIAARHEGGQRLLVPLEAQEILIEALRANTSITIQLEGYTAQIDPASFSENFTDLQKASPFDLPIKLSL